jgi:uncharacterized protein
MLRIALIILIVIMVISLLKRLRFNRNRGQTRSDKLSTTQMVKCEHCQLHISLDDALAHKGLHYCSKEHRDVREN